MKTCTQALGIETSNDKEHNANKNAQKKTTMDKEKKKENETIQLKNRI